MPSLWLGMISCFMIIVTNTIVIPTSEQYAILLGGSPAFSGLSIAALSTVAAVIGAPVAGIFIRRYGLKATLISMACLEVVGNTLYGLGVVSRSRWVVLFGRIVCGIAGPANPMSVYINRGVSSSNRTGAMAYLSIACSAGYSAGPFLAFGLLELASNFPQTTSSVTALNLSTQPLVWKFFNQYTYPGWVSAVMWLVFIPFLAAFFQEPPNSMPKQPRATEASLCQPVFAWFRAVFYHSWSLPLYSVMFVIRMHCCYLLRHCRG